MAKRRFDDLGQEEETYDFYATDAADQAFWDEFWRQESLSEEDTTLVTITIRDEETGEERVIERVRLRFKSLKKLRG